MAKEVMERKASDNKYLHKEFHNIMNLGIEYLRKQFGDESVREYLKQFAAAYYAPLKAAVKEKGLTAVKKHYEEIYAKEEALESVGFSLSENDLLIRVKHCPAIEHMKKTGITISPLYYEMTKTVNETICVDTPFQFELLQYDSGTGASVERFHRK